jgi:hypothetical protein
MALTRVNFVGHGADLKQEGAQSLANKVKILQQTYGNNSTDIRRIALVGCGTDGVNQNDKNAGIRVFVK